MEQIKIAGLDKKYLLKKKLKLIRIKLKGHVPTDKLKNKMLILKQ